jgi:hypothetical protein
MLFSASVTPSGKAEGAGGRAVRPRHASGSASASNPNETANAAALSGDQAGGFESILLNAQPREKPYRLYDQESCISK